MPLDAFLAHVPTPQDLSHDGWILRDGGGATLKPQPPLDRQMVDFGRSKQLGLSDGRLRIHQTAHQAIIFEGESSLNLLSDLIKIQDLRSNIPVLSRDVGQNWARNWILDFGF